MSVPQQQMMYMPGVPLQPALAMQATAGGFVPGPHMAGTGGHVCLSACLAVFHVGLTVCQMLLFFFFAALPQNRIVSYSHYHHSTTK